MRSSTSAEYIEMFEDAKRGNQNLDKKPYIEEREATQWQNEKDNGQTMVYKALHRN